jgi:hypothetical protein
MTAISTRWKVLLEEVSGVEYMTRRKLFEGGKKHLQAERKDTLRRSQEWLRDDEWGKRDGLDSPKGNHLQRARWQ